MLILRKRKSSRLKKIHISKTWQNKVVQRNIFNGQMNWVHSKKEKRASKSIYSSAHNASKIVDLGDHSSWAVCSILYYNSSFLFPKMHESRSEKSCKKHKWEKTNKKGILSWLENSAQGCEFVVRAWRNLFVNNTLE